MRSVFEDLGCADREQASKFDELTEALSTARKAIEDVKLLRADGEPTSESGDLTETVRDARRDLEELILLGATEALLGAAEGIEEIVRREHDIGGELTVASPQGLFMAYIKICAVCGIFLAAPFVFHQIWLFVKAGLYVNEQKYVRVFLPLCIAFFLAGTSFSYFVAVRFGIRFLLSFGRTSYIENRIVVGEWVFFLAAVCLAMGLVFEMPLVMVFLVKIGVVTPAKLREHRKYAILVFFVLGSLLTPPDVITQILMALPMIVLYEVGLYLSETWGKREEAAAEAGGAE